ncbi:MAG: CRISPR system precrRNA processing endoribonuclease RAMP protein Cas6 [Deltaproteobacteria bacterium]|nr:CRISPR system precrRNA processing endoribonuclease RAMP protein Cas6 [Deltaproteobacteria bacterium]
MSLNDAESNGPDNAERLPSRTGALDMSRFTFSVYRMTIEAVDPLHLPPHKGSALRGLFGNVFRKVVCPFKQQDCRNCLLKDKCIYAYVFETIPPQDQPFLRHMTNAPHPFVFRPPAETRTIYEPVERLSFDLILMGRSEEFLPYYVQTFMVMGETGIGLRRGRFILKSIENLDLAGAGRVIYTEADQYLMSPSASLTWSDLLADRPAPDHCTVQFLTPVCLREKGRYLKDIPSFEVLFRSLLRRIVVLALIHCGVDCSGLDFNGLCRASNTITKISSSFEFKSWERYSSRWKCRHPMGGLIGSVTFAGDLGPFWPFLLLGEQVHVGKNTSFGLGQYRLVS